VLKEASLFPRIVTEGMCVDLYRPVSKEDLFQVVGSFQKDKSLGSNDLTMEFFLDFFDLLRDDLLRVVEDVRVSSRLPESLNVTNATFLVLIPKVDLPASFNDF
jgi:hypothetical protein